jgi:hypothetical protein
MSFGEFFLPDYERENFLPEVAEPRARDANEWPFKLPKTSAFMTARR